MPDPQTYHYHVALTIDADESEPPSPDEVQEAVHAMYPDAGVEVERLPYA